MNIRELPSLYEQSTHRSLEGQLAFFLETSGDLSRRWLNTPEIEIYVRRNVRPWGRRIITEMNNIPVLTEESALDIADIGLTDAGLARWETFITNARPLLRSGGISMIYVDEVPNARLKKWCENHEWGQPQRIDPRQKRPYSFFTHL